MNGTGASRKLIMDCGSTGSSSDCHCSGRSVAVQVEFEKAIFENQEMPQGFKGWVTRRFQAMGQLDSTCTAPPQQGSHAQHHAAQLA
jgi:hypothetical protein